MKQKHILKWLGIALGVYLLYGVLTAILVPLPQKEAAGELWSQYEARLSTDASQERVRSIEDTDSALLWRLQLIESAEREVIFSTFDLRADGSGQDLMAALYGAAQRGVRVRIIVDGLNGFLHLQNSGVLRALAAEENVEVRFYDPIDLLRPWKLNYRLHDKYLIADGSKYILGGRNSNDLFLGSYQENQNIDRDVLVVSDGGEGSSVSQLLTYFESVWSQPENKTITGKTSSQTDALQERYAALCAVHGKELAAVDWEVETAAVTHVSLLSGSPRAEAKAPELWDALVRLMAQGDDILLQTPYIICNDKMYNDLEALAETRQLRVLTNAVENGANPSGCSDYLREKQNILSRGVDVYEVVCGQSLHTKTILIGNDLSVVGSFNADMRSAYLDTELMLVIESEEVNAALREESGKYMGQSRLALHDEPYPYILPLNFGLEANGGTVRLYFHGADTGTKYDLIARNPNASFEMDRGHELILDDEHGNCTMTYESVIGQGRITVVPDSGKEHALRVLMAQYRAPDFPFSTAVIPRTTVLCLTVEHMTGKRRVKKHG